MININKEIIDNLNSIYFEQQRLFNTDIINYFICNKTLPHEDEIYNITNTHEKALKTKIKYLQEDINKKFGINENDFYNILHSNIVYKLYNNHSFSDINQITKNFLFKINDVYITCIKCFENIHFKRSSFFLFIPTNDIDKCEEIITKKILI